MTGSERIAKANEVSVEIGSLLGDGFIVSEFSRAVNQPRVLINRLSFISEAVPVCLDQICETYNYRKFIIDRTIGNLKNQIVIMEEAIKKLEALNVKPS